MITLKEINILIALVQTEVDAAGKSTGESSEDILGRYVFSLKNIEKKMRFLKEECESHMPNRSKMTAS
jgi:hypothetical protein